MVVRPDVGKVGKAWRQAVVNGGFAIGPGRLELDTIGVAWPLMKRVASNDLFVLRAKAGNAGIKQPATG